MEDRRVVPAHVTQEVLSEILCDNNAVITNTCPANRFSICQTPYMNYGLELVGRYEEGMM